MPGPDPHPSATPALRALIVDDNVDDADLMVAALESAELTVSVERVDTAAAMEAALQRGQWDVVLCDHAMPGFSSADALAVLARARNSAPVVIVSGAIGEEATVAAMRAGAVDFVSKNHLFRLPAAVQRARDEAAREQERRRRAEELAHARRMESIGRLAGGVAHDLNNKLAVILGFTDVVARSLGDGHPLARELGEVKAAAEYSAVLTRDLLAFGRRQTLNAEPVVAGEVVAGLQRLLRTTIGAAVRLEIEDTSAGALVLADRAQLEQALLSLAFNGNEAMPAGGRLAIRTQRAAAPEPADGVPDRPGTVSIVVSDTGVGMSEEIRQRVFEPFFTTKEFGAGSGLSLAAVLGFVEQLGGAIAVSSRPDHGSTFRIELPEHAGNGEPGPGPDAPRTPGLDVLLVEDDHQVRRLVALMLADEGHRVVGAGTGTEALGVLGDSSRPCDVVVTDMVLPDMRGDEIVRRARELRGRLPVIWMSGYAGQTVTGNGEKSDGFLAKPFTGEELSEAIRAALARDGTGRGDRPPPADQGPGSPIGGGGGGALITSQKSPSVFTASAKPPNSTGLQT